MDRRQMMIWGNLIDANSPAGKEDGGDDSPSLVASSWQLVRRSPDGSLAVLGKGVLAFDLGQDGSCLYSNGSAIYRIDANGFRERLLVDSLIQQVAIGCDSD